MGTVKYTGPVASFHCPTNAEIRSLKVHFSPKQLGEGTPSPENVREIVGWDGVNSKGSSKNLFDTSKVSCSHPSTSWNASTETDDMIFANGELSGTVQSGWRDVSVFSQNIPFAPGTYTLSFDYVNGIKNYYWRPVSVTSTYSGWFSAYKTIPAASQDSGHIETTFTADKPFYVSICLNSFDYAAATAKNKIYNIQLELGSTATPFESCKIFTTDYEFGVLGKNKCPLLTLSKDEIIELGGWQSDNTTMRLVIDNLVPSTDYTLSCLVTSQLSGGTQDRLYLRGTTEGFINLDTYPQSRQSITKTSRADGTIDITINHTFSKDASRVSEVVDIQLELGSTATAYEPYDPNKTVYGGWVDLITGEVCETHTKYVFTGNENFGIVDNYMGKPFVWAFDSRYATDIAFASSTDTNLACNKLKAVGGRFHYLNDGCICTATSSVYSYVLINGKEILGETNEECNQTIANWYSNGTPLTIIAPLRSDYYQFYHLASTQLQTFLGQNNVWSNADYVEVEYDLHETQSILARKQFIVANQPHIVKPAAAPIQTFTTDVPAPLKECKIYFSPVQEGSGDASPENVRVINGFEEIKLLQCKENLWNKETATPQYINSGSSLSASDANNLVSDWIEVIPNKTYIYSYQPIIGANITGSYTGLWTGAGFYKTQSVSDTATIRKIWLAPSSTDIQQIEITIPENCHYIRIGSRHLNIDGAWARFEPYEESQITSTSINWSNSLGTIYGGYVDLVTGELVRTYSIVNLGIADWTPTDASKGLFYTNNFKVSGAHKGQNEIPDCMCDKMVIKTRNEMANNSLQQEAGDYWIALTVNASGLNFVIIKSPNFINMTTTEVKNAVDGIHLCLKLPSDRYSYYQLTPETLKTLRGTNNIWASNGGDNIELAYWTH